MPTVRLAVLLFTLSLNLGALLAQSAPDATVHIDTTPSHQINSFDPDSALGSSLDVLSRRDIDRVHTPHIVQESNSSGWSPITYRNNSELRMAAWHWNPNGSWSDAAHQSGYFTGSTELKTPIRYILSYAHPQWVIVDLQSEKQVNAARIQWASPFAKTYQVEYWVGTNALDFDGGRKGEWRVFNSGKIENAQGGTEILKLADTPISSRYVRMMMSESSNTCDEHDPSDIRDCVGYAVQQIELGSTDASGKFAPAPKGSAERATTYTASSIDPWHSAEDIRDGGDYQHTGFDLFFTSGITNNLPAMIPVTMLYGTPEDAAGQIAYIEKRGYPIGYIEMGEEPDGKHTMPEDYAALYIQWADAIHKVDPKLKLGGPVFEGVNKDITLWPDSKGRISWMGRFVAYLKDHNHLSDLAFVSFEHYPFEPCTITWKDLYREPQLMKGILQIWRDDGVPKDVPLMVTENHLSWQLTGPMTTIFAALWLADNVGSFFEGGGAAFYHSPIQPQRMNK